MNAATPHETSASDADDAWRWLEAVDDPRALAWVRAANATTEAALAAGPGFARLEADLLSILDSDARIPLVERAGGHYYNFWRDQAHPRGIWRRTTPAEYRKTEPRWELLLDLDALNRAEGENWVWHGVEFLRPPPGEAHERCLVALSRGGADADVTREFDLGTRDWVPGGFLRPEAKGALGWIDRDTVFAYTDFGPAADGEPTLTHSGYPRVAKRWRRGTPLASAEVVYAGRRDDMYIAAVHDDTPGFERDFVRRTLAFYRDELYLVEGDGALVRIDAPDSARKLVSREWLTLELREPWMIDGHAWPAGSLLAARLDDFLAGQRRLEALFTPTDTTSLVGAAWTRQHLVLTVLHDVRHRLEVLTPGRDGWQRRPFAGAPEFGSLEVTAVDPVDSDAVWLTATDYLTPPTLALAEIGQPPEVLKSMPGAFDASAHVMEQWFATSDDGTRVPYFLVRPRDMPADGDNPTLLYGYGGFEVSLTPAYSGAVGKGWLERGDRARGGVYAVANIRGGGEYGPRWHQAALKDGRHRAYEDFAAVARDLVARGITSPAHLGIQGGSNGGLLMGNMLVREPGLFGAIVVQVPLLDMQRYHRLLAGASWMAEYGDPDVPADWAFIRGFSPYHLVSADAAYPPVLFMSSTRDDRVHPGHARKMMARMQAMGHDVLYYENMEGGHGGAADNAQAARMAALAYTFLRQRLGPRTGPPR